MARTDDLLRVIAVTAELTGTTLSDAGAKIFADDLRNYRLEDVLDALTRCRRELKSKLTVAAVIERMEYALSQRVVPAGPADYDSSMIPPIDPRTDPWFIENFPMRSNESDHDFAMRCKDHCLTMFKGFQLKTVVNMAPAPPERMWPEASHREPGEDLQAEVE